MFQYFKIRTSPKTILICCLLVVCVAQLNAQVATIISTDKSTYKSGDTLIIRGANIKTLGFRSYVTKDSFNITSYLNKTAIPATNDTNYSFLISEFVKNDVYKINGYNYSNQKSDSQRLVRFFVISNVNGDSLGIVGWGRNSEGQTTIPNNLSNVVQIATGDFHSLALISDGTVVAWGNNDYRQTTIPSGLNNVVLLAGGAYHSLALKSDGTVVAWGNNDFGQTTIPSGLINVVSVSAGYDFSLALKSDGTVVAWGDDNFDQTAIPSGLNNVVSVAAGGAFSLALKSDGTVVAWGHNDFGQTTIPNDLTNVVSVSVGYSHSLALKSDGKVVAWGSNDSNQTSIPSGLMNVVSISAGYYHSLVLKSDSTVVAWGSNSYGQTTSPSGLTNVVTIAAGGAHNLAVSKLQISTSTNGFGSISPSAFVKYGDSLRITFTSFDGYGIDSIFVNGNYIGKDSVNGYTFRNITTYNSLRVNFFKPVIINTSDSTKQNDFIRIDSVNYGGNYRFIINLKPDYIYVGLEINGKYIGKDSNTGYTFYNVRGDSTIKIVSLNLTDAYINYIEKPVYKLNDTLIIRGRNLYGIQIKSGFDSFRYVNIFNKIGINSLDTNYYWLIPKHFKNRLYSLQGINYSNQKSGLQRLVRFFDLNIDSFGIVGWGSNSDGQTTIPNGLNNVVQIASGYYHNLALKSDGTVVAWGSNSDGQSAIPSGLNNVVLVAAGAYHSLALKSDGTVVAWGSNADGQTIIPISVNNIVGIAAGERHSVALKSDGTVVAWGWNAYGQSTIPNGLKNIVSIAAGERHSLALKLDSTVVAWGSNSSGQTTIPSGLTSVILLSAGAYHNLALKSNGTVVAWGWNAYGQSTIPSGLSNVLSIATGERHSLALKPNGMIVSWGDNSYGQTTIPSSVNNVAQIAAGYSHSLALSKLQIRTSTNGFGNISPSTFVKYGDNVRITFNASAGYLIDSLFVNGVLNNDSLYGYTFNNIYQTQNIRIVYTVAYYVFTNATNGTIAPNQTVKKNHDLQIHYLPKFGYELDSIYINNRYDSQITADSLFSYTFQNIRGDSNIRVLFKIIFFNSNLIAIAITNPTCLGQQGSVKIKSSSSNLNLVASLKNTINNKSWNYVLPKDSVIRGLSTDTLYELFVRDTLYPSITRTFQFTIKAPVDISSLSTINYSNKTLDFNLNGSETYYVYHNGLLVKTLTEQQIANFGAQSIPLRTGVNKIEIKSDLACQTAVTQTILISEGVTLYPNPAQGSTTLNIGGQDHKVHVTIRSDKGVVMLSKAFNVDGNRNIPINLSGYHPGVYAIKVQGNTVSATVKLLKH